ncbi:MAG TPA: hypothetical protein VE089_09925 [Nitrososphaeraceae archaeon]|nr:hypothetical protein [Nitrososphaeraceae archaeon]
MLIETKSIESAKGVHKHQMDLILLVRIRKLIVYLGSAVIKTKVTRMTLLFTVDDSIFVTFRA